MRDWREPDSVLQDREGASTSDRENSDTPPSAPPPRVSHHAPPGRVATTLAYLGLRIAVTLLSALPLSFALWIARGGGWFAAKVLRIRRQVVRENLEHVLGDERSPAELEAIATEAYRMCGMTFVEVLRASGSTPSNPDLVTFDPLDAFEELKTSKAPVVVVQPHLGNFDLAAYAFAMRGFHLHTPMKGLRNPRVQNLLVETRERHNLTVHIIHKETYGELLEVLSAGGWVGVLPDQRPRRGKGVEVDFLGKPARIHAGPAVLSLETGARLLLGWIERQKDNPCRHHVHVHVFPPFTPTGDRDADVKAIMQRVADKIGEAIRQAPGQYFWFHRLWGRELHAAGADSASHAAQSAAEPTSPL